MSEWKECKLGEVTNMVTKGTTPKGGNFSERGVNYIKSEAITHDGRIDKSTFVYIDERTHNNLKRSQLFKDDILFSMAGIFLGKNAMVTEDLLPANTNQALAIIRINNEKALPKYISYFLRQKSIVEFVNNMSGQSAQPNINFEEIKSIPILLPPLPEQKAIASVLSSLDDKIDLLHRQNKILEAMAETLFRQWFVPAEASTQVGEEGKEDSEKASVTEFVEFNPLRKLPKGSFAPYLEMSNVNTSVFHPSAWYKREFSSGMKFINGDTLLARITPCLENGKSTFVTFLENNETGWGSTEFIVMRSKKNLHPFFTYTLAKNTDFLDYAEGCLEGSSGRQRVDLDHLKIFKINCPTNENIKEFNLIMESIVPKLHINFLQIRTLEKLRDNLLPKLMSGEVRVEG